MDGRRSIFLYPLSAFYCIITGIRNFLYDSGVIRSHEFSIPVICVGNITVGGTGKTPHTEYIADLLRRDFNIAILSRGYKRKSSGFRIAGQDSSSLNIGDEPLQMHLKLPGVTVAVDSNRVRGLKTIMKERPDTGVIILDDGFQHRRINPGFSIILCDFSRPIIKDHLLPYGNLRESIHGMNRADIILITKSPEDISPIQRRIMVKEINKRPYQNLYFTSIRYEKPVNVFTGSDPGKDIMDEASAGSRGIVLVTGIANPEPLYRHIAKRAGEIVHLSFGDHHRFTENDIRKVTEAWISLNSKEKYLLTTEKDAVRLREFANFAEPIRTFFYFIPVGISFLNDDREEFDNILIDYVRKNKRNNRVS